MIVWSGNDSPGLSATLEAAHGAENGGCVMRFDGDFGGGLDTEQAIAAAAGRAGLDGGVLSVYVTEPLSPTGRRIGRSRIAWRMQGLEH